MVKCINEICEQSIQKLERKKKQLKKFEDSCFGTLFQRMHNIVLRWDIVHNIIIRQVDSMNENVTKFKFKGKRAILPKRNLI